MLGTLFAKEVIGGKFMPPHYFRLSQFLKSRGVGVEAMVLLSRFNICCSDKQRYDPETNVICSTKDDELLPSDPEFPTTVAWDNNHMQATAKFTSAQNTAFIAATGHICRSLDNTPMRLWLESEWRPLAQVALDHVFQDQTRHANQ